MKFFDTMRSVNVTIHADSDDIEAATIKALKYALENVQNKTKKIEREYDSYKYSMSTTEF